MTPINFFSVTDPIVSIYEKGTDTVVLEDLICTARITGSLVAREVDLSGITDGDYDIISELPSPASFALRVSAGTPIIGEDWAVFEVSSNESSKELFVMTIQDGLGGPVMGAQAYVTTDIAGATVIKDNLVSNYEGKLYIALDPGTYYVWLTHPSTTFTNPTAITVTNA